MQTESIANGEIVEASPDRSHLLSMVETVANDPSQRALTLVPLNGGEPESIGPIVNPNAAWAPDGQSFIFYDAGILSIAQVQVADGSRTELARLEEMQNYPFVVLGWTPDGQSVLYTRTVAGQSELIRLDLATREHQTLASFGGDPQPFVVTP